MKNSKTALKALTVGSLLISPMAFSASFYASSYNHVFTELNSGEAYTNSIDLNALASSRIGQDVDFASDDFTINSVSINFNYSRASVEREHEFEIEINPIFPGGRYFQNASSTAVTHEGQDYQYLVEFSESRHYQSTLEDNQTVTITANNQEISDNFIDHIDFTETTEYNIPANTSGVLEKTNIQNSFSGPSDNGHAYLDFSSWNGLLADIDTELAISFLSDNGELTLESYYVSMSFTGPGEDSPPSPFVFSAVQEVPVPAAAWLFGSALLGLFHAKRR